MIAGLVVKLLFPLLALGQTHVARSVASSTVFRRPSIDNPDSVTFIAHVLLDMRIPQVHAARLKMTDD